MPITVPGALPAVPLLVAAMAPQALRVAGELADRVVPFLVGPSVLAEHVVPGVSAAADRFGRPAPRIVTLVPAVVTDDISATRAAMTDALGFYAQFPSYRRVLDLGGVTDLADIALIGDEDHVARGLQHDVDAGATEVVVTAHDPSAPRRGSAPGGWSGRSPGAAENRNERSNSWAGEGPDGGADGPGQPAARTRPAASTNERGSRRSMVESTLAHDRSRASARERTHDATADRERDVGPRKAPRRRVSRAGPRGSGPVQPRGPSCDPCELPDPEPRPRHPGPDGSGGGGSPSQRPFS